MATIARLAVYRPLPRWSRERLLQVLTGLAILLLCGVAQAHGIAGDDQAFLLRATGPHIGPYIYLGAKHMVTGYDHLLFLAGVIFFLYRLKDVALYVTLFAVGHSTTLLLGVLGGWHVDSYLVDAVIGLSVVYKAFENIGGFRRLGLQPNTKAAVLFFGFFHGLGLATKLQDLALSNDGLDHQHGVVQRRRRNRAAPCARLDAHRVQSVAAERRFFSPRIRRQRGADGGGFRAGGISADGFLRRLAGTDGVGEWRRLGARIRQLS